MNPATPTKPAEAPVYPHLKITGLNIRNLGPIERLELPQDGIGWEGKFPDLCVIAGNNGSGKTTLLEFLYWAFDSLANKQQNSFPERWLDVNAKIDLLVTLPQQLPTGIKLFVMKEQPSFVVQDSFFIFPIELRDTLSWRSGPAIGASSQIVQKFREEIVNGKAPSGIVYIPSGTRAVTTDIGDEKRAGPMEELTRFTYKWHRPNKWKNSLESLLYSARWEDVNAIANGHPERAARFAMFASAFERFFGKTKSLKWSDRGELFVEIVGSKQRHELDLLSAGEQQMLVLVGDLMHRWRPGSIILIDEPELHFHAAWQSFFWDFLRQMLRERGGQVILTSQSGDLFGAAELGERLILGM